MGLLQQAYQATGKTIPLPTATSTNTGGLLKQAQTVVNQQPKTVAPQNQGLLSKAKTAIQSIFKEPEKVKLPSGNELKFISQAVQQPVKKESFLITGAPKYPQPKETIPQVELPPLPKSAVKTEPKPKSNFMADMEKELKKAPMFNTQFLNDFMKGITNEYSGTRAEVGRVGKEGAVQYEPKTKGESQGAFVFKLVEDIVIGQGTGLNDAFSLGTKTIANIPQFQFAVNTLKAVADKKITTLMQKLKPLKITFKDLQDVTAGRATPEQRVLFDQFNKLRETGMPINQILKAGEKSRVSPKTKLYDFISDSLGQVKRYLTNSLPKEQQKLLQAEIKKSTDSIPAGTYTGEEIRNKIISTPIQDTAEGKALIKASIQADNTGQSIVIAPPATKVEVAPKGLTPEVKTKVKTTAKPVEFIEKQIETTKDIKTVKSTLKSIQKELDDAIAEAEGKSVIAKEKRAIVDTKNVAKLKRIASKSKEFQAGNYDVLRKKHGNLIDQIVEDVQRSNPELGYDEAIEYALNLPTKAEEGVRNTAIRELEKKQKKLAKYLELLKTRQGELSVKADNELQKQWEEVLSAQEKLMKIVEVPRTQIPIGEGKTKVSRLEARTKGVLGKASQEQIDQLGLSTFNQMNKAETIKKASEYVINNPDEALKVLSGEIEPPKGLNTNSIYVAMSENAVGNIELSRKLASLKSTAMGQNLSILTELDPDSPVSAMAEVIKIREKAFEKKYRGRNPKDVVEKTINDIKKTIKKPDKWDWALFLDDLACK